MNPADNLFVASILLDLDILLPSHSSLPLTILFIPLLVAFGKQRHPSMKRIIGKFVNYFMGDCKLEG